MLIFDGIANHEFGMHGNLGYVLILVHGSIKNPQDQNERMLALVQISYVMCGTDVHFNMVFYDVFVGQLLP